MEMASLWKDHRVHGPSVLPAVLKGRDLKTKMCTWCCAAVYQKDQLQTSKRQGCRACLMTCLSWSVDLRSPKRCRITVNDVLSASLLCSMVMAELRLPEPVQNDFRQRSGRQEEREREREEKRREEKRREEKRREEKRREEKRREEKAFIVVVRCWTWEKVQVVGDSLATWKLSLFNDQLANIARSWMLLVVTQQSRGAWPCVTQSTAASIGILGSRGPGHLLGSLAQPEPFFDWTSDPPVVGLGPALENQARTCSQRVCPDGRQL